MTQKHSKKDYESIQKMTVGEIFAAYGTEKRQVKYEDDKNNFEDIVKIERKKKKLAKKKERQENVLKLQAAINSPDRIDANQALDLADSSSLKASELSKKDIKRLKKLKARAQSPIEPFKAGEVKLSKAESDIAGIEDNFEKMDAAGVYERKPTMDELKQLKKEQAGPKPKTKQEMSIEERIHARPMQ